MMSREKIAALAGILLTALTAGAQTTDEGKEGALDLSAFTAEVHGTIRGKYEYQPEMDAGRFQVRNARFSVSGKVTPIISYKAEIDLSDEGAIKMKDAYTRVSPTKAFDFTIGQMRVPFTIDAHRSPHKQYFANRSFIAKQVGNVRDVGAMAGLHIDGPFPINLQAGLFNGSGLTDQKVWKETLNYSAKAELLPADGLNLTLSAQTIKPGPVRIHLYDAGLYYEVGGWHFEAEYLLKHYKGKAVDNVSAVDAFVCYRMPLRKYFKHLSFLARYDYMGDHSDGTAGDDGNIRITDYSRQRLTGGLTFSFAKPFLSDIRLNYEKYFYRSGGIPKEGEQDKLVIEFMTRF